MKKILKHSDIENLCLALGDFLQNVGYLNREKPGKCYPIPRGGVPAAYALACEFNLNIVDDPEEADFFFDDVIETGATMEKWCDKYPGKPFLALIDKTEIDSPWKNTWVVFPWEDDKTSQDDTIVGTLINRLNERGIEYTANDNIHEIFAEGEFEQLQEEVEHRVEYLLKGLLIDVVNDHNTNGTPERVARMYLNEVFKGRYHPAPKITSFPNVKKLDQMYVTGPITIRSACSHHLVPIIGRCWIGVVPGESVIGLSKFNRLVDWIASRPQIQEELVMQIADLIEDEIKPIGLGVMIEATHMCMTWRGVKETPEAAMVTSVLRGAIKDEPETRNEFISLVSK